MNFVLYCASRDYYRLPLRYYRILEKYDIHFEQKIVKFDDEEESVTIVSIETLQDLLFLQKKMEASIIIEEAINSLDIPEIMIYDDYIE